MNVLAAHSASTSAWDQPGTLGFLVVFGMGVILYFVFRSLVKHLKKINEAARLEAEQMAQQDQNTAEPTGFGGPKSGSEPASSPFAAGETF